MSEAEVLIVEDDADIADLLALRVARQGHHPTVAHTGADAVDRARRVPPDLVLLDLGLPDMHGWDVLDRLRADAATADVPVVIVSVADEPSRTARQVQGHITKPFTGLDLDRGVADALAGARPGTGPDDTHDTDDTEMEQRP